MQGDNPTVLHALVPIGAFSRRNRHRILATTLTRAATRRGRPALHGSRVHVAAIARRPRHHPETDSGSPHRPVSDPRVQPVLPIEPELRISLDLAGSQRN